MKPLSAEELSRYWEFEPVLRNYSGKLKINQFFGVENTSPDRLPLYHKVGLKGHSGLDISTPDENVHAYAPVPCMVIDWRDEADNDKARGDFIDLATDIKKIGDQEVRLRLRYFHLNEVLDGFEKVGTYVEANEYIALTGNTGVLPDGTRLSTGPHLHFETCPQYLENSTWVEDKKNGYYGAVDPIWFFNPKDVVNYPTKIKKSMALRLIKGMNGPQVYALGNDNKKHYIYNVEQLKVGAAIGLWVSEDKIEARIQAEIDAMPEGNPIILAL